MIFFIKKNLRGTWLFALLILMALCLTACVDDGEDSEGTTYGIGEEITEEETTEEITEEETTEVLTEETTEKQTEEETTVEQTTAFTPPEPSEGTGIYHSGFGENEGFVVVIDAGHQKEAMPEKEPNGPGSEVMKTQLAAGTTGSFTGICEYELTLAVSLALRDELLSRGYTVVMVRETNDVKISNMERALLANEYAPNEENGYLGAVNVRVHANGFDNSSARGALMVCSTKDNEFAVGQLYDECFELSKKIIESYCKSTGIPKRANFITYNDGMTGTNWCEIPTTIIEMGFMTNKEDDELMATDAFEKNAASGIADGLDDYFDNYR